MVVFRSLFFRFRLELVERKIKYVKSAFPYLDIEEREGEISNKRNFSPKFSLTFSLHCLLNYFLFVFRDMYFRCV